MLESIDHVNLVVHDLPAMVEFYRDALGLGVTREVSIRGEWIDAVVGLSGVEADVVYLDAPEGGARLELIQYRAPQRPPELIGESAANTPGLRHLAFRVRDIDATVARLRELEVRFLSGVQQVPESQVTYAGGARKRLVYLRDPEGNLLELCEYRGG